MGDYFIGEIRLFPYSNGKFPKGWLECAGQVLQVVQYQALFALLGKQYGGDGKTTFALPDLRGRAIVGFGTMVDSDRVLPHGSNVECGTNGGTETVTLAATQIPTHTHTVAAHTDNAQGLPITNNVPSTSTKPTSSTVAITTPELYGPLIAGKVQALNPASLDIAGASAGHENRQPFLPLTYCIAASGGFYPSRA